MSTRVKGLGDPPNRWKHAEVEGLSLRWTSASETYTRDEYIGKTALYEYSFVSLVYYLLLFVICA